MAHGRGKKKHTHIHIRLLSHLTQILSRSALESQNRRILHIVPSHPVGQNRTALAPLTGCARCWWLNPGIRSLWKACALYGWARVFGGRSRLAAFRVRQANSTYTVAQEWLDTNTHTHTHHCTALRPGATGDCFVFG